MSPGSTSGGTGVRPPVLLGLVGLIGFAALFEILPRVGVLPGEYVPTTSAIGAALVDFVRGPTFWTSFGATLQTWALALLISVAGGVVLGVVIGAVPLLRAATASTIEFLRPIPSVALIPLLVVLLRDNAESTLFIAVYASFWQVLVQVLHGVTDVDPVARETALSYGLGRWARVRYLVWPTALPYAMTGVRLAASVALILTVTGELVISGPGLGDDIQVAYTSGAVARMYAVIVVTGLIGVTANAVARTAERSVLAWHPSVRKEVPV